ncbi:DUF350 domain-containing protein [Kineococcus indalonis]|uniref:DUF350 domain-containing protein n=1 Tax=Kineococcus indalonis TaxID=2696566 RepID=UPI00141257EA|nr:DUF350 domain-containing protein [Kineococcus indalonis]NAZ86313.1 DUF350 domain-containing protein [Kineococcus indalonis]
MLAGLGYAAAYSLLGGLLLAVGFLVLDLLTPGRLAHHIWVERSANAALVLSAGFLGLGLVVFAAIWTNAEAGFGQALAWTVAFGLLGVVLQALAGVVLEVLTPGRMREVLVERELHPASGVVAAAQLAVSFVVVASIW